MSEQPENKKGWRIMRRTLIGLAVFATLVAIFYAEEDWRGKRAWENCKRELEAKGAVLDWNKYIPPPVPDDQNFFAYSTNIALKFVKPQTDEQRTAAARLPWLNLAITSSNCFPLTEFSKTNKVVAELMAISAFQRPSNFTVIKLGDAGAGEKIRQAIVAALWRSVNGSQGFTFSERMVEHLAPAKIFLQGNTPELRDLGNLIPGNLVTNFGRLTVSTTTNPSVFQVKLVDGKIASTEDYLKWSDQFVPDFDEIREALKRPYAMIPGDYSVSHLMPIPNFVTMRMLAQTLAQRTQCYLLLGQPDKALHELTLMHDVCRILEKPPTGKPMTLVEAMINVAISGLYVTTVADGFKLHGWQEPQMAALQEQLKAVNLPPLVVAAFKTGQASSIHTFETTPTGGKLADLFQMAVVISNDHKTKSGDTFWRRLQNPMYLFLELSPRGWWYQNMVTFAVLGSKSVDGFDLEQGTIAPRIFDADYRDLNQYFDHKSPFNLLAAIAIPNTTKATQTLAYNQTLANEAQIACALERYHLAHAEYPETLDALMPQFIEKLPHDIIGGQPLHYRRTDNGKFLLYSVGWNETDDGGVTVRDKSGYEDKTKGDWVWQYPAK